MARTCVRGAELMYEYCEKHDLPVERCGKLVVACNEKEHEQVEKLYHQGTANGVKGLKIINSEEVNARGISYDKQIVLLKFKYFKLGY